MMPPKAAKNSGLVGAPHNSPVTVLFVDQVHESAEADFQSWLTGIHTDAAAFPGFLDVTTIRAPGQEKTKFSTLLKFDSQAQLTQWLASDTSSQWVQALPGLLSDPQYKDTEVGFNPWFVLPAEAKGPRGTPAFWKQTVLGTVTVYPMILLLNYLLDPVIGDWSPNLAILAVVVILSGLLTYPIMPIATKLLQPWLYRE